MAEFVVHGLYGSPFMRAVEIVLLEKGAPYRVDAVTAPESKQQPYLSRQPFGRIPAFSHGDFELYETQAIIRYIDGAIPENPLQPTDLQRLARMNQIIGINDWYFFPQAAHGIVFNRLVRPMLLGLPADEDAIRAAIPIAETCIAEFERLLGDQAFLAGDSFTLADAVILPQLTMFVQTPEGQAIMAGAKRLSAWLGRVSERPSAKASLRGL